MICNRQALEECPIGLVRLLPLTSEGTCAQKLFHGVEGAHEAVVRPYVDLGWHLISRVHGVQRDANVQRLHVAHGEEAANSAATTDTDLESLGLSGDVVCVEQMKDARGEFGVGIEAGSRKDSKDQSRAQCSL